MAWKSAGKIRGEAGKTPIPGVDFPIPIDGIDGEQGEKGDKPKHEWDKTSLRFEKPDGSWGKFVNLQGRTGRALINSSKGPANKLLQIKDEGILLSDAPQAIDFRNGFTLSQVGNDIRISSSIGELDHGLLAGLADDDHTQYALLAGRSGGQSLNGGTDADDDLTLDSTSNADKGNINLGESLFIAPDDSAPGNTGFGVVSWPRGSRLYEQGGGGDPERFFYLANGDRWELLSEDGGLFVASFNGPASAKGRHIAFAVGQSVGGNFFNSTPPTGGIIVEGRSGVGDADPETQFHVKSRQAENTFITYDGRGSFGSNVWRNNADVVRGYFGYSTTGGYINNSLNNGMHWRGENGCSIGHSATLTATFSTAGVHLVQTLTTDNGRVKNTDRITGNTTLDGNHHVVFCDTDGGAFTVTLPAGIDGTIYRIINTGSSGNNVTVAPNGAELLHGVGANGTLVDAASFDLTYETTEGWF